MSLRKSLQLPIEASPSLLIATDIDGTLLSYPFRFSDDEMTFLKKLSDAGVTFLFVTGRTEKAALNLLENLPFPFYFAPQNGTTLFAFPSEDLLSEHTISLEEIADLPLEKWILIGSGVCYYDKKGLSLDEEEYLLSRARRLKETYLSIPSSPPIYSIKRYGIREELEKELSIFKERGFSTVLTRDVLTPEVTVAQITPKGVDKGRAVTDLLNYLSPVPTIIIGCGDDLNDLPLFKKSHFRIAMENAPTALLASADMIAPHGDLFKVLKKTVIL